MKTGASSLIQTALNAGVEICFANAGTTEMPIVVALDRIPGTRVVLGLFEGVCTGAADGWARMKGRPAATLLHLGPGLAQLTPGYGRRLAARRRLRADSPREAHGRGRHPADSDGSDKAATRYTLLFFRMIRHRYLQRYKGRDLPAIRSAAGVGPFRLTWRAPGFF